MDLIRTYRAASIIIAISVVLSVAACKAFAVALGLGPEEQAAAAGIDKVAATAAAKTALSLMDRIGLPRELLEVAVGGLLLWGGDWNGRRRERKANGQNPTVPKRRGEKAGP